MVVRFESVNYEMPIFVALKREKNCFKWFYVILSKRSLKLLGVQGL